MMNTDRVRSVVSEFQRCNAKQRNQDKADRLKYIKNCVAEYNSRLIDGEPKITIVEMSQQLERKV
jgi:hypothetical protein